MRMAECHPNRPHKARGLCGACYLKWLQKNNPEWGATYKAKYHRYLWNWHRTHPQYMKEWWRTHPYASMKKRYGITEDEYHKMADRQNHCCLICGRRAKMLVIDHDHKTGKVRSLLCIRCNAVVGMVENSSISTIMKYLAEN